MVFHYGFVALGVRKIIGLVPSDNRRSMRVTTGLGFIPVAVITEACASGADLVVLTMTRDQCKWLKWKPIHYRSRNPAEVGNE
jgi:RimJ/RimL family protein N-acetyltransferase